MVSLGICVYQVFDDSQAAQCGCLVDGTRSDNGPDKEAEGLSRLDIKNRQNHSS